MKSVFTFESMLTPKIITFVYWLMLFGSVIWGLTLMFGGYGGLTVGKFFIGIGAFLASAVGARIWCELLIVLVKINENLRKVAQ